MNEQPEAISPQASFSQLPSELRNTIYELLLLHSEPIDPWHRFRLKLTTGLFRVCKTVHHESTSLFYSRNRLDLTAAYPKILDLFFEKIGSRNAACVRDVLIRFPEFPNLEPGNVAIDEGSIKMLTTLQSNCTNLNTLRTCRQSTDAMECWLNVMKKKFDTGLEALELVNTHFKAIPSLREVVLYAYDDGPGVETRQRMKEYNWKLSTTSYTTGKDYAQWGRGFSDDDYDNGYGYDDNGYEKNGYDDYCMDNDNDF